MKRLSGRKWQAMKATVFARDGGLCVCCGGYLGDDWEAHHRRYKSRGGRDELANLLSCCRACHHRIHVADTITAAHNGWAVSQFGPVPAAIPVRDWTGHFRILTNTEGS